MNNCRKLTRHPLYRSIAAAALVSLALAACNDPADDVDAIVPPVVEEPATMPPPTEPMPMPPTPPIPSEQTAVDVTAITLGTEADAEGVIASPMTTFGADDDIVVAVDTDGAASNAEVTAKLMTADGQPAAEQSASITTTGADTTAITFDTAEPLEPGDYTVEVWINGTRTDTTSEFTVE